MSSASGGGISSSQALGQIRRGPSSAALGLTGKQDKKPQGTGELGSLLAMGGASTREMMQKDLDEHLRQAEMEKDAEKNRGNANRRRRVNRRMEPKLETKSARRQSRRAFNMETAEMEAFGDGEDSFEEEEKASRDDDDEKKSARGARAGEDERYGDDDDAENADWARYSRARRGADAEMRE